jgi:hypothetical protein
VEKARVAKALYRDLLMVAFQEYTFIPLAAFDQPIDRLARTRSAVNVIAQKNEDWPFRGAVYHIRLDPRQQFVEQIKSAMNVTYRIDPQTRRQRRSAPLHLQPLAIIKGRRHTLTRQAQCPRGGWMISYALGRLI